MNADDPLRVVKWTEAAVHDLEVWQITKGEWKVIRAEVERIANVEDLSLDHAVCRVAQTQREWMRIKITEPTQLRVFFTVDEKPPRIVIRAVLRRSERTYDLAEILFKVA